MSKRACMDNPYSYKGLIRPNLLFNPARSNLSNIRNSVALVDGVDHNQTRSDSDNAADHEFDFNDHEAYHPVSATDTSSASANESEVGLETSQLSSLDFSAGLLSLFFAANLTQSGLKLVSEFINTFSPGKPKNFDQASNALMSHMDTSLKYVRKVLCNVCKDYFVFKKTRTKCPNPKCRKR